jgi:glycosyltransferase involved in cell wall biosynthesis
VDTVSDSTDPGSADITAVVACFNYGRYLREAVDSALAEGAKVIVVDDGSTEALPGLPGEVEVVRQQNQGVARARNAGIKLAETPFVIALDADDRLVPGALAALREPLLADPALGFAYGRMRFFGDWEGELRFPPYDPYALLYRHTIGLSALTRREVFADTGGFDPAFRQFEDWELWVNALAHGWRGRQVDVVTVEYRRHSRSKHAQDRRTYRQAFRQLKAKHVDLYNRRDSLAADSALGPVGRLVHRAFWGPRPMPATLEQGLHRILWRPKSRRTVG